MALSIGYFAILLISTGLLECSGSRDVETSAGVFRGAEVTEGDYYEFLGIPYGSVDSSNPFGVANPFSQISDVYEAIDGSVRCPQMDSSGNIVGSIDCLRLNVYVPTTATDVSQLPVMVFIHGGFFHFGSGSKDNYGPKFLVRHDVILVTINYRVGPYGFMCLNRRDLPGNQGLKDQVLALKWIQDNIAPFGGNPNQVTLFGQSAGAHSVDLHLLSEHDKLYNNVIMQSGSSLAQTVLYQPDRDAPIKLASYLGIEHDSVTDALSSLSAAAPSEVVRAASQLNIQFKPCAETRFDDVEPFITNFWVNSSVPKANNLPILIGFTEYESMLTHINADSDHFQGIANLVYKSLNHTFNFDEERINRMEGYMRRFYLGDSVISQDVAWQVINFQSDYLYNHPIQRSIRKFVDAGASNVFYYMFTYSGGRNAASVANLAVQGAAHADELWYLFDSSSLPAQVSAQDQVIIDRMTTMWTNFAKYNNPTPTTTDLLPVQWIPLSTSVYHYLNIGSDLSMARRPFHKRMAFWDLFLKLNGNYQRNFEAAVGNEDNEDDGSSTITGSSLTILLTLSLLAVYRF